LAGKAVMMITNIQPAIGFFLYVNEAQVQEFFPTLEAAKEAAKTHITNKDALRIQTTHGRVEKWNYRYDIAKWVPFVSRQ
jgi:hypothetical protein